MPILQRRSETIESATSATNRAQIAVGTAAPAKSGTSRARWSLPRASITAALLLLAGVIAVNHEMITSLRDRFVPKRWGVVEEGKIYRSGQLSAPLVKQMLKDHQIEVVVDLTFDNPHDRNHVAELAAIGELGIERKLCPLLSDGTGDVHIYAQAVSAVAEAARQGKPVLVHCAAGTQRTGGVVALYRLLVQEKSPAFTFAEMQKYKYDPRTSPHLLNYVNEHIAEIAADLVRDGTIERIPDPLPRLNDN